MAIGKNVIFYGNSISSFMVGFEPQNKFILLLCHHLSYPRYYHCGRRHKMLKQKVFFFAAPGKGSDMMVSPDDLLQMAVNYVGLYGEGCQGDPSAF